MKPAFRTAATLAMLASGLECTASPPAHWARGGQPLDIPDAEWARGDDVIDVRRDGKVYVNGDHVLTIDRAGRVFDLDQHAVALVEKNGHVTGSNDSDLGEIGSLNASLPGEATAWLTVTPQGTILRYTPEGDRVHLGNWVGECARSASAHEVCVLITHLVELRARSATGGPPIVFGVTGIAVVR